MYSMGLYRIHLGFGLGCIGFCIGLALDAFVQNLSHSVQSVGYCIGLDRYRIEPGLKQDHACAYVSTCMRLHQLLSGRIHH